MLVLVQTNDLGSALLYFGIFLAMLYVATGRGALRRARARPLRRRRGRRCTTTIAHVRERVTIWLHPWTTHPVSCPLNGKLALRQDCESYQLVKSLYSIANGGFGGTGLGKRHVHDRRAARDLIPYLKTDFIYSALAQELGLIGVAALLLVYMLFVARGFRIALLGRRRLLEAARRRAHLRLRAPDVHHRRRDPAPDPADRDHAAVRLLRRLERRRELRAARRAPARLEPRERAPESAMNRQIARLARRDARPARRADRRDDLLADVGGAGPRRPAGQRDPARRAVHRSSAGGSSPPTARRCSPRTGRRRSPARRSTSAATRRRPVRARSSATRRSRARAPGSSAR